MARFKTPEDMRDDSHLSIAEQFAHASNTKIAEQARNGQSTKCTRAIAGATEPAVNRRPTSNSFDTRLRSQMGSRAAECTPEK